MGGGGFDFGIEKGGGSSEERRRGGAHRVGRVSAEGGVGLNIWHWTDLLPTFWLLAQFYSENGPPKSLPKFGAIFAFFCSRQIFFISPKRAKKRWLSFETGQTCWQQIGQKATIFFSWPKFLPS